jgi:ankyrin repeat protein
MCDLGLVRAVRCLWDLGCLDVSVLGHTPFHYACEANHLRLAQWLWILQDPGPAVCAVEWSTACKNGHLVLAQWLVAAARGVVKETDFYQRTLDMTCLRGHLHVVRWLHRYALPLALVASINEESALRFGCLGNQLAVVRYWGQAGANVFHKNAMCFRHVLHVKEPSVSLLEWLADQALASEERERHLEIPDVCTVLHAVQAFRRRWSTMRQAWVTAVLRAKTACAC